jgi:hypothetical protein
LSARSRFISSYRSTSTCCVGSSSTFSMSFIDASPLKEQQTRRRRHGACSRPPTPHPPRAAAAPPPARPPRPLPLAAPTPPRRIPPRAKKQRTPSIARPRFSYYAIPQAPCTASQKGVCSMELAVGRAGSAPSQPTRPFGSGTWRSQAATTAIGQVKKSQQNCAAAPGTCQITAGFF